MPHQRRGIGTLLEIGDEETEDRGGNWHLSLRHIRIGLHERDPFFDQASFVSSHNAVASLLTEISEQSRQRGFLERKMP